MRIHDLMLPAIDQRIAAELSVGTTTVNALMYYTSDGQLAALLPSNTPTGMGAFTVNYNAYRDALYTARGKLIANFFPQ